MSTSQEYSYETATGFSVITFNTCLSESKWGDIERVGTELKAKLAEQSKPLCLLDLSKLEFMGSLVVALLVRVWKTIQERQGEMVVVNPNPITQDVLDISGLSKLWTICETRSEGEQTLTLSLPPVESGSPDIVVSILGWIAAGMALVVLATREPLLLDAGTASLVALVACGVSVFASVIGSMRAKDTWRIFSQLGVLLAVCIAVAVIARVI